VTVWDPSQHAIDTGCNQWRAQSITDIKKLSPSLVLLSDRTTSVDGSAGKEIPDATWKAGMEKTLSELLGSKLKLAVIGDIAALTNEMPECLAAHPSAIQDCSSPNPNPGFKTHVADEMAAAKAEGVTELVVHEDVLAGGRQHGRLLRHPARVGNVRRVSVPRARERPQATAPSVVIGPPAPCR
jgi:hypothetical protein